MRERDLGPHVKSFPICVLWFLYEVYKCLEAIDLTFTMVRIYFGASHRKYASDEDAEG